MNVPDWACAPTASAIARIARTGNAAYLAKGKQYVAIPAGVGGGSWTTLITPELAPEIHRPNSGNGLFVFALPGGLK